MTPRKIAGLLNIDKPKGITSHDVVARVRKLSKQRKVGHTGTLDPMATGVLLVCLGQATRLIEYQLTSPKQYRATIQFGITTTTLDAEGDITAQNDVQDLTQAQIRDLLPGFLGKIQQTPPAFSAIKKDGRPLYKRARTGETVEIQPRTVTIYDLSWVSWDSPNLVLDVTCSSGTYIRSLAQDLGQALGVGAHLAGLVRTANGSWTLAEAISLDSLEQAGESGWQQFLHPPDEIVMHLPRVVLDNNATVDVIHGRQVQFTAWPTDQNSNQLLRAYTSDGKFLAILKLIDAGDNIWQPKKVFHA